MKENTSLIKKGSNFSELSDALEMAAAQFSGGYDVAPYREGRVHLRDYWRAVRKHLWLVISITLLIPVMVAVYMASKPDIYMAQVRVQVDLESNPAMGALSKGGQVVLNSPVLDPNYFNTQLKIIEGPGLLRRAVKTLDMENNPEFVRPRIAERQSTWKRLLRMVGFNGNDNNETKEESPDVVTPANDIAPLSQHDDPAEAERLAPYVEYLQGGLRVEQVKDTRLINISFRHLDPVIATKVVNTIADIFVMSNLEKTTSLNSTEGDFLQKRIAELQSQIRSGEEQLAGYAKSNQILSLVGNQNTVVERLVGLNQQLLQAENERKEAEAAYQTALAPGAAEALTRESATQSLQAESNIAQLRQRRALLLVKTTEEWPEVKEIDRQIDELEKQLRDSRSQAISVLLTNRKTRYQQAAAREQALRTAFNRQKGETLSQNEAAINYRILQQEIDTNRDLLKGLLQRSKENDVIVAGTANNIHVVDYALTPRGPIGLNGLFAVLIAFPLALGLGIGLAIFLSSLNDTVQSESDVEKFLKLSTLAIVPSLRSLKKQKLLPAKYASKSRNGNGNGSSAIMIVKDTRSPMAEAYRQLRTAILLSGVGGAPKTILVASSLPSEGKTTTAVNLAISLAKSGAEVLLIDADMRRPRLHSIFNLNNDRGLSTIISSNAHADEVSELIIHDEESNLNILTAGPMPPNPSDHLGSEKMQYLINMFGSAFTYVIIDSPPLTSFTDGVILSTLSDKVLLVVQSSKGSRDLIRRSTKLLQDVGANIAGVVLNNVHIDSQDEYYYPQYYSEAYLPEEDAPTALSGTL